MIETPQCIDAGRPPRCLCVAHRGFSAKAPENTLIAIREAVAAHVDAVEFDVRMSKDHVPVLLHDSTVNRTTDGRGKVEELSLADLKTLDAGDWKHKKFAGEPIPTLAEVLAYLATTSCKAVIELKDNAALRYVLSEVEAVGLGEQVYFLSPDSDVLTRVRTALPHCHTAWLCQELPKQCASPLEQTEWIRGQLDENHATIVDAHYKILSDELIRRLQMRDITVWTWTVNDFEVMKTLRQWGVDAITTDHPDLRGPM